MAPVAEQKCVQNRIRSFIILDLETTGLPHDKPVKVTEITMVAALREHIAGYENDITKGDALPRVLSKLTICVCPRRSISQRASDITHLTNELLEHQSPFDEHLFNMLHGFMNRMPQPVCIIAHNGLRYDFPILQTELFKIGKAFPDHILCADSLRGFQNLLKASKTVKAYSGKPATTKQNSILRDIQPLIDDVPQDGTATNQVCTAPHKSTLGVEVNELHLNDYDEALCLAVEAVETVPLSESNSTNNLTDINFNDVDDVLCCFAVDNVAAVQVKGECKVKLLDLPKAEKKTNPMENDGAFQNILEKTPDRPTTAGGIYPNPTAADICPMTPKAETSESTKGKRGHLNTSCQARQRLFPLKEKPQNTIRSLKLDNIYRHILKRDPMNSHCAESDALHLLECIVTLGQSFIEWVDENAVQFNSIKRMG